MKIENIGNHKIGTYFSKLNLALDFCKSQKYLKRKYWVIAVGKGYVCINEKQVIKK